MSVQLASPSGGCVSPYAPAIRTVKMIDLNSRALTAGLALSGFLYGVLCHLVYKRQARFQPKWSKATKESTMQSR